MNDVVIDTRTGRSGTYAEWVMVFAGAWRRGRASVDDFMNLMSPEITLRAPGLQTTHGREQGRLAFRRTFALLPDLTATVDSWAASHDRLFIEMTFTATIAGRHVSWKNVDQFIFRDRLAIERTAFFNPVKVRKAFFRHPKGWLQWFQRMRSKL